MAPFQPKDPNGVSQAEKIRQWIVNGIHDGSFAFGTILKYDDIAQAAGIKPTQRGRIQAVMSQQVARLLETHHHRTIKAVRNVGYQIAHPREHEKIGDTFGRKASAAKRHQVRVYKAADGTALTKEEQYRLDRKLELAQRHEAFLRRRSLRTAQIDALLKKMPPAPATPPVTVDVTPESEEVQGA